MTEVTVHMGDDIALSGHATITFGDIPTDAEDITDEEIVRMREAAVDVFVQQFGERPKQIIVTCLDSIAGPSTASHPRQETTDA